MCGITQCVLPHPIRGRHRAIWSWCRRTALRISGYAGTGLPWVSRSSSPWWSIATRWSQPCTSSHSEINHIKWELHYPNLYFVKKVSDLIYFAKTWWISMKRACIRWPWTSTLVLNLLPPVNSVSWWQEAFEWRSIHNALSCLKSLSFQWPLEGE